MSTIGTATNSSPYLAAPAAAAIENGKNHFVTLGENGVSLATAMESATAAGQIIHIQITKSGFVPKAG